MTSDQKSSLPLKILEIGVYPLIHVTLTTLMIHGLKDGWKGHGSFTVLCSPKGRYSKSQVLLEINSNAVVGCIFVVILVIWVETG